jgi:hypothetical protein
VTRGELRPRPGRAALGAVWAVFFASYIMTGCGFQSKRWAEPVAVTLKFTVVDGQTKASIGGATLVMIDRFGERSLPRAADRDGLVAVTEAFGAMGDRTARSKTGRVTFDGWLFEATAPGYSTRLAPLADLVPDSIAWGAPPPDRGSITLLKTGTNPNTGGAGSEQYTRFSGRPVRLLLYGDRFYAVMNDFSEDTVSPWFACVCGPLARDGDTLTLKVEREKKIEYDHEDWHLDTLCRVPWGGRLYLIAPSQWLDFCNAVNQAREPRSGDGGEFFLRDGDLSHSVNGLPKLPVQWNEYLLREPLRATVVRMGADGAAVIDAGATSGLRKGMELMPEQRSEFSTQVVESVEADKANLKTKYPDGSFRRIRSGDVVVSRFSGRSKGGGD